MNLQSLAIALCGIAIMSASCTKQDPGAAEYKYTFQNPTDKRLHVDIYQSADDYNNNRNVYLHSIIDPGSSYQVSNIYLQTNIKYYVDWYSDDYTYSNWINRSDLYEIFDPTIVSTSLSNTKKLETEQDFARMLCLGGSGTSTTWKAIDGYTFLYNGGGTNDTNYWQQLPSVRKNFTITFHKDYSATYSFINSIGQPASVTIFCRTSKFGVPNGSTQGILYFYHNASIFDMNGQLNSAGVVNYYFNKPVGDPGSAIADSILVSIDGVGSFTMIKQNGGL